MKRPTDQQIEIAIAWLDVNEGDGGEAIACKAVAGWLTKTMGDIAIRQAARRTGFTAAEIRKRITENKSK